MQQIHWFPGHMQKARRQIEAHLKLVDVVFELVDARIPYSSRNPLIDKILHNKLRIVILNKSDLADPLVTTRWEQAIVATGAEVLTLDALASDAKDKLVAKAKQLLAVKMAKEAAKGLRPRPVRAMIIGIPNVGKSTLINTLAKRKAAMAANKPGVTRAQQWVKVGSSLELLDTPGLLWPKFESRWVGLNLALTGAIKDTILPMDDVAIHALSRLCANYPQALATRYGVETEGLAPLDLLTSIGRARNLLISGGAIDETRVCELILKEIRDLKLGRLTFETPDEVSGLADE